MADEKPLTQSSLVAALKEVGVVTKDDLKTAFKEFRQQVRLEFRQFCSKMR